MKQSGSPSQEYVKNAVLTATPEQLQLMLYDGAIRFTSRGLEALQTKDLEGMFSAFERAQQIVLELSQGLRRDVNPELADRMAAIYDFIYRRLVDANVHRDEVAVADALRLLRYQRETWVLLMEKLQKDAQPPTPAVQPVPAAHGEPATSTFSVEG